MVIVLIHIGEALPPYFYDCAEQCRRNFDGNIHVVVPRKHVTDNAHKRIGLHPVAWECLVGHSIYQEFKRACFLDGFWNVTMGRLFVLEILIRQKHLTDIIHIENDVLIYKNPNEMIEEFRHLAKNTVLLTPIGDNYISAAYLYTKSHIALAKLNTTMLGVIKKGKENVIRLVGNDPNEMMILSHIWKRYNNIISLLPIQPEANGSQNLQVFGSLFDGASAGQYIGGTQGDGPGWAGSHHWLGKALLKGKYSFVWYTENGIKKPLLVHKNRKYKINNLHIHSKNLKQFM